MGGSHTPRQKALWTIGILVVRRAAYDRDTRAVRPRFTLEALEQNQEALIGGVDWITKKWLLEAFMESEGLGWDDPWLQSIDLEYHNIDPERGLFFGVTPGKRIGEWNNGVRRAEAMREPPGNTRAAGRAVAVAKFQKDDRPYVINWDSIAYDSRDFLVMGDPFETYTNEVTKFVSIKRPPPPDSHDPDAMGRGRV